jgi:hypothetical protein
VKKRFGGPIQAPDRNRAIPDCHVSARRLRLCNLKQQSAGNFRLYFNEVFTITGKAARTGKKGPDHA